MVNCQEKRRNNDHGDRSAYTSKPLPDFIYECNQGKEIFFVSTKEEALELLTTWGK